MSKSIEELAQGLVNSRDAIAEKLRGKGIQVDDGAKLSDVVSALAAATGDSLNYISYDRGGGGRLVIPNGTERIGNYAFCGFSGPTTSDRPELVLPTDGKLKYIGENAFNSAQVGWGLASLTIPEGVEELGVGAFYSHQTMTYLSLPSSLVSIGESAFNLCQALTSEISLSSGRIKSIGDYAFNYCQKVPRITVYGTDAIIGTHAFSYCRAATEINLSGVKQIGPSAFASCNSVKEIWIPSGVDAIYSYAFSGCSSVTSVTVRGRPTNFLETATYAFNGCPTTAEVSLSGFTSEEVKQYGSYLGFKSGTEIWTKDGYVTI